MSKTKPARWEIRFLIVIFLGPVIAAWAFYFGPEAWRPAMKSHHGLLVNPARPIPQLSFRDAAGVELTAGLSGKWTLLHLADGTCDASCAERLWQTRQLRSALHRYRDRVQRVYLASEGTPPLAGELAVEHPRLRELRLSSEQFAQLIGFFGPVDEPRPVFLIDPLGNWLMVYGDQVELKGMHKDLKKLIKLSQIG